LFSGDSREHNDGEFRKRLSGTYYFQNFPAAMDWQVDIHQNEIELKVGILAEASKGPNCLLSIHGPYELYVRAEFREKLLQHKVTSFVVLNIQNYALTH